MDNLTSVTIISSSQPFLPIFTNDKYDWWTIKIKTLKTILRSQGLRIWWRINLKISKPNKVE